MSTESRYSATSFPVLDGRLERREPARPEAVEVGPHAGEPVGVDGVRVPGPLPRPGDEAGLGQDTQVVGRGLLGEADVRGDGADGVRAAAQDGEDGSSVRVGERFERRVEIRVRVTAHAAPSSWWVKCTTSCRLYS